jgi:hypothetical protein
MLDHFACSKTVHNLENRANMLAQIYLCDISSETGFATFPSSS